MDPTLYRPLFLHIAVIISLMTVAHPYPDRLSRIPSRSSESGTVSVIAMLLILWLGLRPIHGTFIDTTTYAKSFYASLSNSFVIKSDILFNYTMQWFARSGFSVHLWLLFVEAVYIGCTAWATCKLFPYKTMTSFAFMLAAFSFFAYGTNGIRNGMACSVFLVSLTLMKDKRWILAAIFAFAAMNIHKSLLLPIVALAFAYFYRNTKAYALGWVACIALSLVAGDTFIDFFTSQNLIDTGRDSDYLSGEYTDMDAFSHTGFRYDFLLYGCIPIIVGCYFVFKKNFDNTFYRLMLNVYIICNSFWILVNSSWLSNRIAYLSWFIYGFVLMYPLLESPYVHNRKRWVVYAVIGNAAFSYLMWILGKYR